MKYLLIAVNAKYIHSNLAVYDLRAYAQKYYQEIQIAEYTINQNIDEILRDIYRRKPDFLAFSCYIWNIAIIEQLIPELHKVLKTTPIWLGGPEASYRAKELIDKYKFLKGVMTGEGEESFLQLLEYYHGERNLDKVQNLCYRKEEEIRENQIGKIMNLSHVPFPYQDFSIFQNRIVYYESSRGCPFSCSYCLSSIDKKLRFRDLELVKKELQIFLDIPVKQVKFVDRTFNCKRGHALEIWNYLIEKDNKITNFHFEISADLLTQEELSCIKRMRPGLIQLEIGVQSTNTETLKAIRRKTNLDILKKNVEAIHEFKNTHQHLDLIAGLPYENIISFQNSFNEVYNMKPHQLQLGFLKVLSGTQIWEKTKEYGIVYQDNPPYEVLYTKWITYDEILKLKGIEEMIELYYNSMQFSYSISYLLEYFETPFACYEKLSYYYQEHVILEAKQSRVEKFLLLFDFAKEYLNETALTLLKDKMVYDFYLRENAKNRPKFAMEDIAYKEQKKNFYQKEANERKYLKNYQGYDGKQLAKMTHLERFQRNPITGEDGVVWVLFDYQNRDPLNYAAKTILLEFSEREASKKKKNSDEAEC